MLEATQVVEQIETHPTHWIFIDGELVTTSRHWRSELGHCGISQLSPAIVGGCY